MPGEAAVPRGTPCPKYTLGMELAGLIRMMDWEPGRPRRWPWQEFEDRDSDLAITTWTSKIQHFLRPICQEGRPRAYRRILVIGIGSNLSQRRTVTDLDQLRELLEEPASRG